MLGRASQLPAASSRHVWLVVIAASLVAMSFLWETAYDVLPSYYIKRDAQDAGWFRQPLPVLLYGNRSSELAVAQSHEVLLLEFDELAMKTSVARTIAAPDGTVVLGLLSSSANEGLDQNSLFVIISVSVPKFSIAMLENASESDDESEPRPGSQILSTFLYLSCFDFRTQSKPLWNAKVPFSVEMHQSSATLKDLKFEATGLFIPGVSLHKGDAHGGFVVSLAIDETREPYLFAFDAGTGALRWKQHTDTDESLFEQIPEKLAEADDGAGGYKVAMDHSFRFEAVVREAEQSAHMQELDWRRFRRDVLTQSSPDSTVGTVLPHSFFTAEALLAHSEMPFQIREPEANVDRVSIVASHFNPPSRQNLRASASERTPNVLLVHHNPKVSRNLSFLTDLYTGRVLTYVPMQPNKLYLDLDATGTVDTLAIDPNARVVEAQDAFNGGTSAGSIYQARFNVSLDESGHIPPLERIVLSMRAAAVEHSDTDEGGFRSKMFTQPIALHPSAKGRMLGSPILNDVAGASHIKIANIAIGSADAKQSEGWTILTMDGRGELVGISHTGKISFKLLTDASWRSDMEHAVVSYLPVIRGFCLHNARHCAPENQDAVLAVGLDNVVVLSGGKILASVPVPIVKPDFSRKDVPSPLVPQIVFGDQNQDGTTDFLVVFEDVTVGFLLESSSEPFMPVMVGAFVITLLGMLLFRTYGVAPSISSTED